MPPFFVPPRELAQITIIGNWKMHGDCSLIEQFVGLDVSSRKNCDCSLVVPEVLLPRSRQKLVPLGWSIGAQNVSEHEKGAYTGSTSAAMLAEAGCDLCLAGHSERRAYQHESDTQVAEKILRLKEQRIRPVVCIGETLKERDSGHTSATIASQLQAVLAALAECHAEHILAYVAYEPVWAIGTGKSATPDQAQQVHHRIRTLLNAEGLHNVRLLYGGSVNGDTIAQLVSQPDIDGALVGGASLTPAGWEAMLKAVSD